MLTSFTVTDNYRPLSATYLPDSQVDLQNYLMAVDGNLNAIFTPILSGSNDFIINNYSNLNLTSKINISNITEIQTPTESNKIITGLISNNATGGVRYLRFSEFLDDNLGEVLIFDQTVITPQSALNDFNYFEIDITDTQKATVATLYAGKKYFLAFNPSSYNLNFVVVSAFNSINDFTRKFDYTFNDVNNIITLQTNYNGIGYRIFNDLTTGRLGLIDTRSITFNDSRGYFQVSFFKKPDRPVLTIDWGSYEQTLNQNNLLINTNKSKYNLENNFLTHTEYLNINETENKYSLNIVTLKNQLNAKYDQGRGNIFLNQPEVNYRNYISLAGGGNREHGYENLHLQFESYTTPYTFKSGKTTWFHAPQNMYPYSKLNIQDTKLIEAGAVAGDHPLRSDKVFKKLANYKASGNLGNSSGEQTGQWLCSWLSGAPDIGVKPVWVDRYYNPQTFTAYQALTAEPGNVSYFSTFDCLNTGRGVSDVASSLTFEPGCLYAYSHIGKIDALQNIKMLEPRLQQKNFNQYLRPNGQILDPVSEQNIDTYLFQGDEYAYIDVVNFNLPQNQFTLSFWMYSDDWARPKGYQLLGNFNDYGVGLYNYNFVTPFIFLKKQGKILSLNKDFEILNIFDSGIPKYGDVKYILRRDALNSFHCITNTNNNILEFDIKETLIDASSALSASGGIKDVHNDEGRVYVLYNDNSITSFSVFTNNILTVSATQNVGYTAPRELVKLVNGGVVTVAGTQTKVRATQIFFLSSGFIQTWNTQTGVLCAFIGDRNSNFDTFNIDRDGNTWVAKDNTISVYGDFQLQLFTTTLTADSSISTSSIKIKYITYIENFESGQLTSSVVVCASGSDPSNLLLYKLNYKGETELLTTVDTGGEFDINFDPANHDYNYSYLAARYPEPLYTFKVRLYNQFDTEDVEIPFININAEDLGKGWHNFVFQLDTLNGQLKGYVDGTLYQQTPFTANKFNFIPLVTDRLHIGASSFYSGLTLFDVLDKFKVNKTSYLCKDFKIQNLYFYNNILNFTDINMLYKEKIAPKDLIWDVPSGRRTFTDVPSRFFKQRLPGSKSTLYNLYINDNLLTQDIKDYLTVAITNKLRSITPAYSKLNSLQWISTIPTQEEAPYFQPYFTGNTLTNAQP